MTSELIDAAVTTSDLLDVEWPTSKMAVRAFLLLYFFPIHTA